MSSHLFLPHHPGFYEYLHSLRPPNPETAAKGEGMFHYVVRAGSLLVEAVPPSQLDEYLGGGEYDEALEQQEEQEQEELLFPEGWYL